MLKAVPMPTESQPLSELRPQRLVAASGASLAIHRDHDRELLRVADERGRVIFEYDATSGRGAVTMAGGIALHAPEGDIDLVAGGQIRCFAGGEVAFQSASAVSMNARDSEASAGVRVEPRKATIAAPEISAAGTRADLRFGEAVYRGQVLTTAIDRVKATLGKVETVAEHVVARAGNLFQHVTELQQTRAGRWRTLVDGFVQLRGDDVRVDAVEDVTIDGERINLG